MLHRLLVSFVALSGLLGSTIQAAEAAAPAEDRFDVTVLQSGMPQPLELAVAPDGRVFWNEIGGTVKLYDQTTHMVSIVGSLKVWNDQENGLLGMAMSPDFMTTGNLFLMYSPPDKSIQRISRFTVKDNKIDNATEKVILEYATQREQCCHHAGTLAFGPDGCLLISAGDNTSPFASDGYDPIDERAGRAPFDAQKSASNTNDLRGKVLRIKPRADGSGYDIPEGNLFPVGTEKTRPEIYVMGCRNPWRMSVDPKTGYVYWGEVGPDSGDDNKDRGPRGYDEINQARKAGFFGWPYFVGDNYAYNHFDFATNKTREWFDAKEPRNTSPNNTGLEKLPPAQPAFIWYPGSDSPKFPEVNAGGGRTACAGPVYYFNPKLKSDVQFPDYFDHCLFIFEWSRNWVKVVHLDADNHITKIEPFLPKHGWLRPCNFAFGPGGEMYAIEYGTNWGANNDSKLLRIDYAAGNRAPIARAAVENNIGKAPLAVKLSSAGSMDKDAGDTISFEWRAKAGGPVLSTEANPTVTFKEAGVFNVELTVKDNHGKATIANVPVIVGNAPPKVAFDYPIDGQFVDLSQPVRYKVSATDEEDGPIGRIVIEQGYRDRVETLNAGDEAAPGLALIRKSDCFNCHALDHKIVGPAYIDVANKYRNDPNALGVAAQRVIAGSVNIWGPIPMLPHPQHNVQQTAEMVKWVLALKPSGGFAEAQPGAEVTITPPALPEGQRAPGLLSIQATYTDHGGPGVGPLTGAAKVVLRNTHLEAENFDTSAALRVIDTGDGGPGQKMLGGIESGGYAEYKHVNLRDIVSVTARVASGGSGGIVELRAGSPTGKVVGTFGVKPTGGYEKWVDVSALVKDPGGTFDLFVVFTHPGGGGGLMNLNWIDFQRESNK
jgi:cytochrome c